MAGENGVLSVANFGSYSIRIQTINYGFQVISYEEMASVVKAFYPWQITQAQFSLVITLPGRVSRDSFNHWMRAYMLLAADPNNGVGPVQMRVIGPRGFDFMGSPTTGLTSSTDIHSLVFQETINFEGSSPTSETIYGGGNEAVAPVNSDPSSKYFYPGGTVLNGKTEDALYNTANPIPAVVASALTTVTGAVTNLVGGF